MALAPALAALALALLPAAAAAPLPFMDPALAPEQRAKDLVARLTLDDQVGLLLASSGRSGGVASVNISGCSAEAAGCTNITDCATNFY